MLKKLFFALSLVWTTSGLFAATFTTHPPTQLGNVQVSFTCNLPAPSNFQVIELTNNSVKLSWDIVPAALQGYRIRTYRSSDNALISTIFKPQDILEAEITGLSSGEDYYSLINSIDENNQNGEDVNSVSFKTLILDLVVIGFQSGSGAPVCEITNSGSCSFSPSGSNFRIITPLGKNKDFILKKDPEGDPDNFLCQIQSNQSPYFFTCSNGNVPDCNSPGPLNIKNTLSDPPVLIATFDVGKAFNTPSLNCSYLARGYIIQKLAPMRPANPRGNALEAETSLNGMAFPNPFANTLEVSLAQPINENLRLQLFNLNGQKVLDQSFQTNQDQYLLSTEGLPLGFYMLRIEADGQVQTLKVVKSE